MEHYNTLKEIDARLKILRLQRDISLEQLRIKRHDLLSHFRIPKLSGQISDHIKKTAIFLVTSILLRRLRAATSRKALNP